MQLLPLRRRERELADDRRSSARESANALARSLPANGPLNEGYRLRIERSPVRIRPSVRIGLCSKFREQQPRIPACSTKVVQWPDKRSDKVQFLAGGLSCWSKPKQSRRENVTLALVGASPIDQPIVLRFLFAIASRGSTVTESRCRSGSRQRGNSRSRFKSCRLSLGSVDGKDIRGCL